VLLHLSSHQFIVFLTKKYAFQCRSFTRIFLAILRISSGNRLTNQANWRRPRIEAKDISFVARGIFCYDWKVMTKKNLVVENGRKWNQVVEDIYICVEVLQKTPQPCILSKPARLTRLFLFCIYNQPRSF
jgi:hypothetical protein